MDRRVESPVALFESCAHQPSAVTRHGMDHDHYMNLAIEQAEAAAALGEIPIGAVLVYQDRVIGAAHNRREIDQDPVAHAELLAIRQAARVLGSWRLLGSTLYVTTEPCPMCAGALVLARVERLVFGCRDPKAGAVRSLHQICDDRRMNHRLEIVEGVQGERCAELLSSFFSRIRNGSASSPETSR